MGLKIMAWVGSLRSGSLNRKLLEAAIELSPEGMVFQTLDLAEIPFFNADLEEEALPEAVSRLRAALTSSSGLLIVTPEYNYGPPGIVKNALDWASRPPGKSSLQGKPVALMGATPGSGGTGRAQLQLRQSLLFPGCPVLPSPEVLVARAHEKFDAGGRLTDEATRTRVRAMLEAFAVWVRRFTERPGVGPERKPRSPSAR
jgi:chromate reductase